VSDDSNRSDEGGALLPPASVVSGFGNDSSDGYSYNTATTTATTIAVASALTTARKTESTTRAKQTRKCGRLYRYVSSGSLLGMYGVAHANSADGFIDTHPRVALPDARTGLPARLISKARTSSQLAAPLTSALPRRAQAV
jgi:hypothetical protein